MKSPFAILLAIVALLGVGIGVVAIIVLGPEESDTDEAIQVASETELPTPTTRTRPTEPQSEVLETTSDSEVETNAVVIQQVSSDELNELKERVESGEAQIVTTIEATNEESSGTSGAVFAFRGAGAAGGGGPGGGNFTAIQEAIEGNPEIAALIEKAQSGSVSQADQARLRELMQEVLSEAGVGAPGGGGIGFQPVQGKITSIAGSAFKVEHSDESGITADVQVSDDTSITLISELTQDDLAEGDAVSGIVQRGEGGKINILALSVVPDVPRGGFGLRGLPGAAAFGGGNTNVSSVEGSVSAIEDGMVHLETDQGTLRLTVTDDTAITSTVAGTISDLTEGTSVIVIGPEETGAIQARNVVAGPEALLSEGAGFLRGGGAGWRGQGQ